MKCKERVKMEIQLWRSILCPYELAVRELEVKFNHIIDECKENYGEDGRGTGGYRRCSYYLPV